MLSEDKCSAEFSGQNFFGSSMSMRRVGSNGSSFSSEGMQHQRSQMGESKRSMRAMGSSHSIANSSVAEEEDAKEDDVQGMNHRASIFDEEGYMEWRTEVRLLDMCVALYVV